MNLEKVKLGKNVEYKHIPLSELTLPSEICLASPREKNGFHLDEPKSSNGGTISTESLRKSMNFKRKDLEILKQSIERYGLLAPFQISEVPEDLGFFYDKRKYFILDGRKRYLAIRELLFPLEEEEILRKNGLCTNSGNAAVEKVEMQVQERFANLSIWNCALVPCLVYPYKTNLESLRHRMEDGRLNVKPSRNDCKLAEEMRKEGILDLEEENLSQFREISIKIEEAKQALEVTLQEIRSKINGSCPDQIQPKLKSPTNIFKWKSHTDKTYKI